MNILADFHHISVFQILANFYENKSLASIGENDMRNVSVTFQVDNNSWWNINIELPTTWFTPVVWKRTAYNI